MNSGQKLSCCITALIGVPGVLVGIIDVLLGALDVFGIGIVHTFVKFCISDR